MTTTQSDCGIVGTLCRNGGVLVTVLGVQKGLLLVRDVTGGAEELVPFAALEGIDGELARWAGAPLFMQLQPQADPGNHGVEEGDPVEVDVAPVLAEVGGYERGLLLENLSAGRGDVPGELYVDAVERGLVAPGYGSFRCDLSADDVALWCAANPYRLPQPRTAVSDRFTE